MMNQDISDISVQELISGMIISKDVIRNGTVLLREGSIVNEEIIDRLKNVYFIDKIQVYIPAGIIGENRKEVEIKKVEQAFQEVTGKLKELFSRMESLDQDSIADLREFAWKIEQQFKNSELVLSNVIFKGNGGDYIYRHGVNVAVLSALLGKWVGLDSEKINSLIYSALLHDFGMTKLKKELQKEPDLISYSKNAEVKEHVKIAYNAIQSMKSLDQSIVYGVLMHHERCDGSGYPLGVANEKIHPFAKIIAIADEIDVLNSNKELRDKKGAFYVLKEIKEKSLNKLDYEYSKTFLEHISNFYSGEEVKLNNGDMVKILQINIEDIEHPLLLKDGEFIDLKNNKDLYIKELIIK